MNRYYFFVPALKRLAEIVFCLERDAETMPEKKSFIIRWLVNKKGIRTGSMAFKKLHCRSKLGKFCLKTMKNKILREGFDNKFNGKIILTRLFSRGTIDAGELLYILSGALKGKKGLRDHGC